MRLIDADALIDDVDGDLLDGIAEARAIEKIENAPTVDAAPVKHGRWAEETDRVNHWHCSECGAVWGVAHRVFKYCPNCGAKMDLGETS